MSSFVFAYSMNSIGEILKEMGRKESKFKERMGYLNDYMEKRDLDPLLQMKVRKYFQYLHKEELEDNEEATSMLSKLAHNLQTEV